ncbi:MAG: site-specific DNA-methyltransferase [Pseudanabaena sp. M165S2SP1A06QC]|nr:site-specific DNA-methyltransferase [Pseudanabaena sp. M090S1SP2A07QC]MCA6624744.1 site-specific DNA-methyltransferase [Pseudanabaena sp. M165S2SP1A06QC]
MTDNSQLGMNLPNTQNLDTVEGYKFEPIKGYPMLHWKGKRPFTSTQFYPAQQKESHGADVEGWRNKIFWGDNLQVMSHLLKDFRGKVNLVYIDPPFDSKADYKKKIQLRGQSITNDQNTFEEKQYTDIWNNDEYLQFMYERLILIRELLDKNGNIVLHCDSKKNHFLRIMLDEIFGYDSMKNEVIRVKCNPKNSKIKAFGNIHDSLYIYTKDEDKDFVWNYQREEIDTEDIKRIFEKFDANGRRYTTVALHAPGERKGETGKPWRNILPPTGRHWAYVHQQLDEFDTLGKIEWSSSGVPRLIRYADEKEGDLVQDIWTMKDPQYAIYPTEKPEDISKRLIQALTNKGDLVFDCFMGSGTTQAVSMELGRRFIGADINLGAVQITTKRLLGVASELEKQQQQGKLPTDEQSPTTYYTGFEVYNVNHYDVFRNPLEAKDLLLEALEIQRLDQGNLFDGEKDGRMVKIMPVNRIATKADLNEITTGLDYKTFERRQKEAPNKPVEKITLICMGHEPDLAATLISEVKPFNIDVEVVDILRDKSNLEFKRDSEAKIKIDGDYLIIDQFYPMNLLQKLSLQQENVEEWRELVESVMIDWNYDGAILEPKLVDIPDKKELVSGRYKIPEDAGTIRVRDCQVKCVKSRS